jgi:hypothetical protein
MTDTIIRSATLSKDGVYRYVLHRDNLLPGMIGRVVWIMLNPSTADAEVDDPTIRRCMRYAQDWGYANVTVVNLFPLRTPDPKVLAKTLRVEPEPKDILKMNLGYIESECHWNQPGLVVCAWGTEGGLLRRNKLVIDKLNALGVSMRVLGLTEDRHPKHPLYLKKDLKPVLWSGR